MNLNFYFLWGHLNRFLQNLCDVNYEKEENVHQDISKMKLDAAMFAGYSGQ